MIKLLLTAYCLLLTFPLHGGYFIDSPSPSAIYGGDFDLAIRVGPGGSLLVRLSSAPFDRLSIGLSYGGDGILGYEKPSFYKSPGVAMRLHIFEGTSHIPGIMLGFDSQGYKKARAKGVYGLLGKEISRFHSGIGVNYNTDGGGFGLFLGTVFYLSYNYALVGDYSIYLDGEDLLGFGIRVGLDGVFFQLAFRDIITGERVGRVLDIGYEGFF